MLPLELNKLLIIVVVLSMALTPFLNEAGRRAASFIEEKSDAENVGFFSRFIILAVMCTRTQTHMCMLISIKSSYDEYWCI